MGSVAVFAFDTRLLDLGRQGVQIHQQEVRQAFHASGQFLGGWFGTMQRLVTIKSELIGPVAQCGGYQMLISELLNAPFELPRFYIRRKLLERHFHTFAQHTGCRRPFLAMQAIACLYVVLRDSGWCVFRRRLRMGRWLHPYNSNSGRISKIARPSVERNPMLIVDFGNCRSRALWTFEHDMLSFRSICGRYSHVSKTEIIAPASRAVVCEDHRHAWS